MDVVMALMLIALVTPVMAALLSLNRPSRIMRWLSSMLIRVWESIVLLSGRTLTHREEQVRLTLDARGMTLEQASDAHYDADALERIRTSHRREHLWWQQEFKRIEKVNWMLGNDDPDIVDEAFTIHDFSGQIIRQSRAFKTTTVTHRNGMTHKSNEVCYKCDR